MQYPYTCLSLINTRSKKFLILLLLKMSKGKRLSEYEKGKIDGLKKNKLSGGRIAKIIKRSKTVVNNYIKLKEKYGLKGKRGRKKSLSKRTQNLIARLCSNKMTSASKIKS